MTQPTTTSTGEAASPFAGVARRRMRDRVSTVDQLMGVVAAVLLPLGLVMVFLGWYGASHTPYLFEQIPYLVSGGLLGLGLVMAGGFVLFGSWIARTANEQRARDLELLEAVRGMREELSRVASTAAQPVPAAPVQRGRRKVVPEVPAQNGSSAHGLVATARGSMLHRPDCAIVTDRDDVHDVTADEAEGMRSCRLCEPLAAAERARA